MLIPTIFLLYLINSLETKIVNIENSLQKCDIDESMQVISCLSPMLQHVDYLNVANFTRARGRAISNKCEDWTKCLSKIECMKSAKVDKVADLLCDSLKYFVDDFTNCRNKINRFASPCLRELERSNSIRILMKNDQSSCEFLNKSAVCIRDEVTEFCGKDEWEKIKNLLIRMLQYGSSNCKLSI